VAALIILVLVLVCLPFIERIPAPVLAAIVIHAVSKSLSRILEEEYERLGKSK